MLTERVDSDAMDMSPAIHVESHHTSSCAVFDLLRHTELEPATASSAPARPCLRLTFFATLETAPLATSRIVV